MRGEGMLGTRNYLSLITAPFIPDEGLGPVFRYPEEDLPRTRRRVGKGQARGVTGGNHAVINVGIKI